MNESEFHLLADATLAALCDTLENADASGALDIEYGAGVATIQLPDGKQWVISKHMPSRQIWLSSPLSGGLHFSYHPLSVVIPAKAGILNDLQDPCLRRDDKVSDGEWVLPDGRTLAGMLSQELGIKVEL